MLARKLSSVALIGIAVLLVSAGPGYAAVGHAAVPSARPGAAHPPAAQFHGNPGFNGHHVDGHHFDGHHDGRFHSRVFIAAPFFAVPFYAPYPYPPAYPYEAPAEPPVYQQAPQSYWYYCPSYGAYYPSVQTCPDQWVPVPAS